MTSWPTALNLVLIDLSVLKNTKGPMEQKAYRL
jgi:hypothetical protein